jgi:hypothetical protein
MTQQMARRRRNPKGGRHLAGDRWRVMKNRFTRLRAMLRMQDAGHDTRIHLSAAC